MNGWNETELEVTCWDHSLPKTREQRGGVGGGEESRGGRGEGAGKLRNSEVKLMWWAVVSGGAGMRGFS